MVISIVGLGLIGGSIALRSRAEGHEVVGYDRDPSACARAVERGAVDRIAAPEAAVAGADLVILATPIEASIELALRIAGHLGRNTVVTDAGSAKAGVVEEATRALGGAFVGGHPMAGSERHGIDAADPQLFEDAWWILTPVAQTAPATYNTVATFVGTLGARPIAVEPAAHDRLVARLSHVPQLTASTVVDLATGDEANHALLGLAAGGFRDVTRIAASDPDLWVGIVRANRKAVLEALDGFSERVSGVARLIEHGDWEALHAYLKAAGRARAELFAKATYAGEPVALTLLIPDRPGVLAEVTTAAGELGVNIEDIEIFHSTEGGRGRLELIVAGEGPAEQLVDRLTELGYHVDLGLPG